MRKNLVGLIVPALILVAGLHAQAQSSPPQSTITIHVGKAGLFSGFGHNHTIAAPVEHVTVDPQGMKAELTVLARTLKVTDQEISDKDRAEIQATMLGPKVLDVEKFPEIRFQSSHVEKTGEKAYRVSGFLQLHGVRKQISLEVTGGPERYRGRTNLKQSDYGIQPVSVAGGAVKVKDELELEFDIYAQPAGMAADRPVAFRETRR